MLDAAFLCFTVSALANQGAQAAGTMKDCVIVTAPRLLTVALEPTPMPIAAKPRHTMHWRPDTVALCIRPSRISSNVGVDGVKFMPSTKSSWMDHGLKQKIHSLRPMFGDIEPVALTPAVFSHVRYNRNNRSYRFLLNVCRMVADNLLPSEDEGSWHFVDFTRDEQKMNQLFEKFVFNFYRLETSYKVRVEEIKWKLDSASPEDTAFLPIMRTDITLQNSSQKIIMDAKYYRETMSERYFQKKIKSGNMYQLFSYLINQETTDSRTLTARGILLYPSIDEEYDLPSALPGIH